mmetsp:Transcript_11346/g.36042  ORF Transcript_11346/g.36042 Transcript_11346/m.36042 type:complete len:254 (-) Transcript_11346:3306-4067(-)
MTLCPTQPVPACSLLPTVILRMLFLSVRRVPSRCAPAASATALSSLTYVRASTPLPTSLAPIVTFLTRRVTLALPPTGCTASSAAWSNIRGVRPTHTLPLPSPSLRAPGTSGSVPTVPRPTTWMPRRYSPPCASSGTPTTFPLPPLRKRTWCAKSWPPSTLPAPAPPPRLHLLQPRRTRTKLCSSSFRKCARSTLASQPLPTLPLPPSQPCPPRSFNSSPGNGSCSSMLRRKSFRVPCTSLKRVNGNSMPTLW